MRRIRMKNKSVDIYQKMLILQQDSSHSMEPWRDINMIMRARSLSILNLTSFLKKTLWSWIWLMVQPNNFTIISSQNICIIRLTMDVTTNTLWIKSSITRGPQRLYTLVILFGGRMEVRYQIMQPKDVIFVYIGWMGLNHGKILKNWNIPTLLNYQAELLKISLLVSLHSHGGFLVCYKKRIIS